MASPQKVPVQDKIVDVLNKDIDAESLIVKPSSDFFKAIDSVHRLQNDRNGVANAVLPNLAD